MPTLETRLAEMDRRLRDLQADLLPELEPSPEGVLPAASEPAVERAAEVEPAVEVPAEPDRDAEAPAEPSPQQLRSAVPQSDEATEGVPKAESIPSPPPESRDATKGRTGPLASLLQRGSRRDPSSQQIEVLAELSGRLMGSLRELLAGYEAVITQARPAGPPLEPPAGLEHSPAAQSAEALTVSAGPLHDTAALYEFERAMSSLPGVREVSVRSYEGADRAILHVELE